MPDRRDREPRLRPFAAVVTVVEDDPALLGALTLSLEVEGYTVRAFPSGEALLADSDFPIAGVMVIDYRLPGMDGLALIGRLRARGVMAPAALITTPTRQVASRAAAADIRLLSKPLTGDTLSEAVRDLLARHAPPPPAPAHGRRGDAMDITSADTTPSAALAAKLAHEANLVSLFFEAQPGDGATDAVADHLGKYWAPQLRRALFEIATTGTEDLRAPARAAILKLAAPEDGKHERNGAMDDPELEARLKMAIDGAPALRYQAIHLKLEADRVILEGSVDSAPDRELAEHLVQANAGLRVVEDRLRIVKPEPSA